jgi:hypothetical protein
MRISSAPSLTWSPGAYSSTCTTLVTKQSHSNHPAAVYFTHNVFFWTTRVSKEDLVEFRVTRHHLDRTNFNAGLTHVN